jgi:murein endopeptidase/LysM repeat protein
MRLLILPLALSVFVLGCAHLSFFSDTPASAEASARGPDAGAAVAAKGDGGVHGEDVAVLTVPDLADGGEEEETDEPAPEEGESHELSDGGVGELRYTAGLSDQDLQEKWKKDPAELGCISLGFADEGRLLNAEQFPKGKDWVVVSPERAWGTPETINYIKAAIERVKSLHPDAPPLRVNQISAKEGGYLRPHKSHQNGRDADLAFYYHSVDPVRVRAREKVIDVKLTWELLKSLVTQADVQMILVDRRVQKVLKDYALQVGEDKDWVQRLFRGERHALIQHARHHRDHFHVRFYSPVAQELGRRVAPLLAQRPEQNLMNHKVHSGDTLGAIARKYGTSVAAIQKANHMKGSFLRLAQVLRIPLHGPCTHCPVPAPMPVPPRLLPPAAVSGPAVASAPPPAPPRPPVAPPQAATLPPPAPPPPAKVASAVEPPGTQTSPERPAAKGGEKASPEVPIALEPAEARPEAATPDAPVFNPFSGVIF